MICAQRFKSSSIGQRSQMSAAPCSRSSARFCGWVIVPPPSERMRGFRVCAYSATMRASLLAFEPAEFRFARASENFGNREANGVANAPIKVRVHPSKLAGQQARGGRFAAAHESSQADQPSRTNPVAHHFG